jgi:hypothetical protein
MNMNFPILLLAALIPLLVGMIWYHPKAFGNAWMKTTGLSEEKLKEGNMLVIFGVTYLFCVFIAFVLQFLVVHQYHVFSVLANEPGVMDPTTEIGAYYKNFMDQHGHNFRSFKHGALHGFMSGLFLLLPAIGVTALFERKSFKYIFINGGYWIITLMLMGGVICQFA